MPRIAHHAQDQRVGDAPIAVVEFREGLRIAPLHARDETAVVLGGVNCQKNWKQHHANSLARFSGASNCIYE